MQPSAVQRARAAVASIASTLDLTVDDIEVLHNSNKLALRMLPCDVFARVAPGGRAVAQFEVDVARRLAGADAPIAVLEPRVAPGVHERDGFAVTLWTHYESVGSPEDVPSDYAHALARLHVGMRTLDVTTPHFTDRVAEALRLVERHDLSPALGDADRELLRTTLRDRQRAIEARAAPEQLLHGEPHPGNVLRTGDGMRFIDLETCCRGPVEFDLAHVPEAVGAQYPDADTDLVRECRILVLAMVAAWRWDRDDEFPDGRRAGREIVAVLRNGPPWTPLDDIMRRPDAPAP